MRYYNYIILKKAKDYLAVVENRDSDWELGHLEEQGYVYITHIKAFNANSAISQAKENEDSEISKLNNELYHLRQENRRLKSKTFNSNLYNTNSFSPLEVLGFSEMPTKNKLKIRYKELSKKFHPDAQGSTFIMQLINEANEQLSNEVSK